jgi:hypothetical protein
MPCDYGSYSLPVFPAHQKSKNLHRRNRLAKRRIFERAAGQACSDYIVAEHSRMGVMRHQLVGEREGTKC